MASDALNNDDRSPCLVCPHRDMDKNKCSLLCLRLAAYNSGKSWQDEPLPYIAKQEKKKVKKVVKIMEETETGDQKLEVGDLEDKPRAGNICMICQNPDKPILNERSKTCRTCYQRWRTGVVVHPTLGKFVPSQVHHKSKTKVSEQSRAKKETQPKKEKPVKSISRSYPFPDLVTLDFGKYLEIKAVVFETASKFLMPPEHIIISLVGEGIVARKKNET